MYCTPVLGLLMFFGCVPATLALVIFSNAKRVRSAVKATSSDEGRSNPVAAAPGRTVARCRSGTTSCRDVCMSWPARNPCLTTASYWTVPSALLIGTGSAFPLAGNRRVGPADDDVTATSVPSGLPSAAAEVPEVRASAVDEVEGAEDVDGDDDAEECETVESAYRGAGNRADNPDIVRMVGWLVGWLGKPTNRNQPRRPG